MPSHVRRLGQPLRSASQKLVQQRTVFPSALVNFGIALLTAIVLLSFFSCDFHTEGDAKDIAFGSAATRAVSDVAGCSACGVTGETAGVGGADRSRRHRGVVCVAGIGASVGVSVAVSRASDEIAGSVAGNAADEKSGAVCSSVAWCSAACCSAAWRVG